MESIQLKLIIFESDFCHFAGFQSDSVWLNCKHNYNKDTSSKMKLIIALRNQTDTSNTQSK